MALAIAALLLSASNLFAQQHNIAVHVVDADTGKPLPHIYVNLRLGDYPGRKTIQAKTDSTGTAFFYIAPPLPQYVSADGFSSHYHEIKADPAITSLPQEVTIPMRHLNLWQSLHYLFMGD